MTKVSSSVIQMSLLVIVLLLSTFYLFYPRREGFIGEMMVPLTSVYKNTPKGENGTSDDSQLNMFLAGASDKNDLLHMRRCYQFPNETIESFKNKYKYVRSNDNDGMYFIDFDMIVCNFAEVESRIICELQKFRDNICLPGRATSSRTCSGNAASIYKWSKTNGCPVNAPDTKVNDIPDCTSKIHGPVYALVFQAPYYRAYDEKTKEERVLTNQYHTGDFKLLPYNAFQDDNDSGVPLYIYVQLLFSRYNQNGTYLPTVDFMNQYYLPEWDRTFYSKEKQCFIQAKNKPLLFGGCATMDEPYKSICLGPRTAMNFGPSDEKNTVSSYGILYTINTTHVSCKDLFNGMEMLTNGFVSPQVFFRKGDYKSREEADAACKELNASLASDADIQNAHFAGANWCEKGWTADDSVASVAHGSIPACTQARFDLRGNPNEAQGAFCYGIRPSSSQNIISWNPTVSNKYQMSLQSRQAQLKMQKCGTFDAKKYVQKYPEAKQAEHGAFWHWANIGISKGYKVSFVEGGSEGEFDPVAYRKFHTDIDPNTSVEEHLKSKGWQENRRICIK